MHEQIHSEQVHPSYGCPGQRRSHVMRVGDMCRLPIGSLPRVSEPRGSLPRVSSARRRPATLGALSPAGAGGRVRHAAHGGVGRDVGRLGRHGALAGAQRSRL